MRSLADQDVVELGGRWSVLTLQKRDHIRMNELLDRLPTSTGAQHEELVNRLCRLVFSHAFAEEAVLWPALRRHVPAGEALTAQVEVEHQQITELVAALEGTSPGDPRRPGLLDRTTALLRQDARDEEDVLLPRLQDAVDVRTLRRLGVAWGAVRRTAPTRTHPVVARRPPGNVLAALPLSAIDRTRDALDVAARRLPAPLSEPVARASDCLGGVARSLEHLPPLRHGERPETHQATGADTPPVSDTDR